MTSSGIEADYENLLACLSSGQCSAAQFNEHLQANAAFAAWYESKVTSTGNKPADITLLELAAKAAGLMFKIGDGMNAGRPGFTPKASTYWQGWNPLTDDGDALRLAVKLGITPQVKYQGSNDEVLLADCAWVRRAIVKMAAEIGKGLP